MKYQRSAQTALKPAAHLAAGRLLAPLVALLLTSAMGSDCGGGASPPQDPPPIVSLTINAIPEGMDDVIVVPPSGFVVAVQLQETTHPVDPESLLLVIDPWGAPSPIIVNAATIVTVDETGGLSEWPAEIPLIPGSVTIRALVSDVEGNIGTGEISFAVRDFPGGPGNPPIGSGQAVWLNFLADRDAVPGPDFDVDLEQHGLGSPQAPTLSAQVRQDVIAATIARVWEIYYFGDPTGIAIGGGLDIIEVAFVDSDPGLPNTTEICVGGADPSGGIAFGNVLFDLNNGAKSTVECSDFIPTGVFPREFLYYAGNATFQQIFDPLRPAAGGTPVGEDPLDAIVLAPLFDPGSATPEQLARYDLITEAIDAFSSALGTIVAHESGHALGLVPTSAPGVGLYGDVAFHNLTETGAIPSEPLVMNPGPAFADFAVLAGLGGNPRPYLRALNHAYGRDRIVIDPSVKELLGPPTTFSVVPNTIDSSGVQITISGDGFAATPSVKLVNPGFTYQAIGEALVSAQTMTAWVIQAQVLPGLYDLVVTNPDGQVATLPSAVTVE